MITQDPSSDRLAQIEARLAGETTLWNDDNTNAEPDMRWLIAEVKRLRDVPLPDLMQLQRVLQGPWVGDSERQLVEAEALVRQRLANAELSLTDVSAELLRRCSDALSTWAADHDIGEDAEDEWPRSRIETLIDKLEACLRATTFARNIMALIPEISVKPTTDPEYPGVVISLDGEDLVLFERLPTGSYAAHVWEHEGEDPIYAHIYPRTEEPSDVTGDKGSA